MTRAPEVVVVDDDEDALDALADLIRLIGPDASPFLSARHARDYICGAAERIAMVVTDLEMPDLNGEALAREVHMVDETLPVVLVSGAASSRLDRARSSGLFLDVISKTSAIDDMIAALRQSLAKSRET